MIKCALRDIVKKGAYFSFSLVPPTIVHTVHAELPVTRQGITLKGACRVLFHKIVYMLTLKFTP